jgi:hypothetical protein
MLNHVGVRQSSSVVSVALGTHEEEPARAKRAA